MKKLFNWSELHLSEVTSYKIYTLDAYVVSSPACTKNLELTLPKVGDPLQPQLVGPLHHLMLQGFCQRLAEGATKAFHEDGPFRPCQPTIGKPSHPKTAILLLFFCSIPLRHLPL